MSFIQEFKDFINKGNMIDMAVAVVMGTAFKPVISTLVEKMIMPPIGIALGGVDFKDLAITIQEATETKAAVVIGYGAFIQSLIDFAIIGLCVFLVVKAYNAMQKKEEEPAEEPAPAEPAEDIKLLQEIRDTLKQKATV